MHSLSALFFAGCVVAFPFPQAGTGKGPTNSCDARKNITPIPGNYFQIPIVNDCATLASEFLNGQFSSGEPVQQVTGSEAWHVGSCEFTAATDGGQVAWLGNNDASDLIHSAIDDWSNNPTVPGYYGELEYWVGETGNVPCNSPSGKQVTVHFKIHHTPKQS